MHRFRLLKLCLIVLGFCPARLLWGAQVSILLNWYPEPEHAGLYVARDEGLFRKEGLDVRLMPGGAQVNPLALLATGKVDVAISDAAQVLLAREEGVPVMAFFSTYDTFPQAFIYHLSHPLRDFADLAGRNVIVSPGASYWVYLEKKYRLQGKVRRVNPTGQMTPFLRDPKAAIEGFAHSEPFFAKKAGAEVGMLLIADSGFNPYGNVLCVRENTWKEKPDLVKALYKAVQAGWARYWENPARADKSLLADNPQLFPEFLHWAAEEQKAFMGKHLDKMGKMEVRRWQELALQMQEIGQISEKSHWQGAYLSIEP